MRKAYGEKGYINFTAIPTFDIEETNDCISLIVELDEGKQFRIDRVQVLGTDPQTAQALINRSGLTSGSVFVFSRLEDLKLSEPDISEALDEKRGTVDLTIDLRDCHLR